MAHKVSFCAYNSSAISDGPMESSIRSNSRLGSDQGHELDLLVFCMFARVCDGTVGIVRERLVVNRQHLLLWDQMERLGDGKRLD